MNSARIALRNLSRQKKRSFLLGGAIAFGILIITLVNSFTAGVVENVQENFSHFLAGHIFLSGYEKSASGRVVNVIRDDRELTEAIEQVEQGGLRYIARRSSLNGVLIFEGENARQQIVGVNWDEERYLKERLVLREGNMETVLAEPHSLVLNEKVAARLGVAIGETLLVQMQTVTGQQNVGEFVLAATSVDTGIFSGMSAYGHRGHVNELINIEPEEYITLGIFLEDMGRMELEGQRLYQALQGRVSLFPRTAGPQAMRELMTQMAEEQWQGTRYQLSTISDYLQPLDQIASTLNIVGLVVVLILFVIIMVGITNTFRMIIYERTREIGTMRALGLQRGSVRSLFLLEALFLALGGALIGLLGAFVAGLVLSLINFGVDNQFFVILREGHLSFKVLPAQLVGNIAIVAVLTLLAALVPAGRASRLDPAHALRKTY